LAIEAILSKKGRDIVVLDVHEVSGVADFFVVATGDSDLQIKAIYGEIRELIRTAAGEKPWHSEGTDHLQWVLMDYVDLVVHIFNSEKREFYSLERLWGDAPREEVPDDGTADQVSLLKASK
jgi:ribosome-associated protein